MRGLHHGARAAGVIVPGGIGRRGRVRRPDVRREPVLSLVRGLQVLILTGADVLAFVMFLMVSLREK